MPRSQAVLHFDWLEGLDGCTDVEILVYCTILTEPTINQAGVGALRLSLWARRLRKDVADVETALKGLDAKRYVFVDDRTEEILVRTLIRRDKVAEKPNLLWAAVRQAPLTRSPRLRRELAAELRKLPAQQPDSVTKSGRRFVHADPHATADTLDPPPVDNPPRERFGNGSRTHPEPISGEPFENPSRTTGGGGGGGGGGSSPVGGLVGEQRATRATTPNHPHDERHDQPALGLMHAVPPLPDQPPRCRRHAPLPVDVDVPPCRACMRERERWEQQQTEHAAAATADRAAVAAALRAAAAGCDWCDEHRWRLTHPGGPPVEPARRCDHQPPQPGPRAAVS